MALVDLGVTNWIAENGRIYSELILWSPAKWGQTGVAKRRSGNHFFQKFGAGEVPLEYIICKDQLFQVIDCFRSSGKLQQVQLPKAIEKFDLRAKVSKKTFIFTN